MTTATQNAPAPNSRAEATRQQRRRRSDLSSHRLMPLSVAGKKDPAYEYRWVNADPGRVHQLTTMDDWDIVTIKDLGDTHEKDKGVGTGVERVVDRSTGRTAVLMRKLKEYVAEDRAKQQAAIDEREKAISRGVIDNPEALSQRDKAYIPDSGIKIERARS